MLLFDATIKYYVSGFPVKLFYFYVKIGGFHSTVNL